MAKPGEVQAKWWLVDATDKIVGRLASEIAMVLMGKHRPTYTPHVECGDFVVVINAEKIKVTGNKLLGKRYQTYSGYPSGLKTSTLQDVLNRHPDRVIRHAVNGMVPDGPLGRRLIKKLKVYAGPNHPHQAQPLQPTTL